MPQSRQNNTMNTVLTIAGSDPSGGAGIQADLKTIAVIGVYGAAAVTCITVQNSRGVSRIEPLAPDLVAEQIDAVLSDHRVCCIKIGMIGNAQIAGAVGGRLASFQGDIVVDPVLVSTTGQKLLEDKALAAYRTDLLCRATVLTPNLPELRVLAEMELAGESDLLAAGNSLLAGYPRLQAILIKGGHAPQQGTMTDYLVYREQGACRSMAITHPSVRSSNGHGTGCTLAAAFAAYRCLGSDYLEASRSSVDFVQRCLTAGSGRTIVTNPAGGGGLAHHLAFQAR
jgi:hydroxymethylpyrimidine/phosphomethylpyrimidine kinase